MDAVGREHFVDRCCTESQILVLGEGEVVDEHDTGLFCDGPCVKSVDWHSFGVVPEGVSRGLRRNYDKSPGSFECHSRVFHVPRTAKTRTEERSDE